MFMDTNDRRPNHTNESSEIYLQAYRQNSDIEYDTLTGLYNREAFLRRVHSILQKAKPSEYILNVTDVDYFKVINELFGHDAGDEFLKAMGKALQKAVDKEYGICCRLHTDNFASIYRYTDEIVNRLNAARHELIIKYPLPFEFVLSTGRYVIDDPTLSPGLILDRAMMARKTIKGIYDRRDAYYTADMREAMLSEQEIISEMRHALNQNQFQIHLQPQFIHAEQRIFGAEALIRWQHPTKGNIPPNKFIPIFERNDFITALDLYVVEQACKAIQKWKKCACKPVPLSVNLSRMNFYNTKLTDNIFAITNKYEIQPQQLKFEITESAYADNPEQLIRSMNQLRDKGFSIELDDFGSGYSSLTALANMPLDTIKLDMRFILNDTEEEKRTKVLECIVALSKSLNLEIIAEGIETNEQAEYLAKIGCKKMQGYYYARPMPIPEFENLILKTAKENP